MNVSRRPARGFLPRGPGRPARQPSFLGVALVLVGLLVILGWLYPPALRAFWFVFTFWPLILVLLGLLVLFRRSGWLRELELNAPSIAAAISWPRRLFAAFLITLGVLLLPFTLHLVDERVLGALLLIALGVFLIWRRTR